MGSPRRGSSPAPVVITLPVDSKGDADLEARLRAQGERTVLSCIEEGRRQALSEQADRSIVYIEEGRQQALAQQAVLARAPKCSNLLPLSDITHFTTNNHSQWKVFLTKAPSAD